MPRILPHTIAPRLAAALVVTSLLAGCGIPGFSNIRMGQLSEHECMMRAMYFESNRSSSDGMLAVGTVVMNRVDNPGEYPTNVCGVVGQPNQFADGVLTRPMTDSGAVLASEMAGRVLRGERHSGVGPAEHFHTAGLRFPYNNMHYVLEAGGNEFYIKMRRR